MEYKSLKCNLLFYLSRIIPSKDFKMLCKQYLKSCEAVPEMSKSAWKCIIANYKLRKKNRDKFKVVSLGWDCMPRTLLTLWMLKPSKGVGEKGMLFDLTANAPHTAAHFLENDFADYFDGEWSYDHEHKYWLNAEWTDIFYPHDGDCDSTPEGLEKLKKRMAGRIENFREAMAFPGPILFVMHKATLYELRPVDHKAEDIERVCRKIAEIRGDKPFKIVVIACDHNDDCEKIDGAEFFKLRYPHAGYIWHLPERFTPAGVKFEIDFMDICRNALSDLLQAQKSSR